MTQKRFNRVGGYVYDNDKCISHFEDVTHRDNIVELLNELHEENQYLHNIINCLEKGSCRSIDSFLDGYCTEEMLKEFDLE